MWYTSEYVVTIIFYEYLTDHHNVQQGAMHADIISIDLYMHFFISLVWTWLWLNHQNETLQRS